MVQVTFTDDARRPKVITFGGTPLVKWYAYLRDDEGGRLYLRREVDGVIDTEVLVLEANPPIPPVVESLGISWFSFHVDPNDATKAYIYFIADGTLWRVEVTSTPVGEEPTTQQFDRDLNRYERYPAPIAPSVPLEVFERQTTIPTPGVAIVETTNPLQRQLIVTVPLSLSPIFEPDTVEIYQLLNGGNATLYHSTAMPLSRQVILTVATNAVTFTKWAARTTKAIPDLKSQFGSDIDNGILDTDAYPGSALGASVPVEASFRKVDRAPIKASYEEAPVTATFIGASVPHEQFFRKVDRAPIKTAFEEPAVSATYISASTPHEAFFRKS